MLAAGLCPKPSWADAGSPDFLTAARMPGGSHSLVGLDDSGLTIFKIALPGRGHAAAAHPSRPEAVAFARRPGTFAIVLDCVSGRPRAMLETPRGRHFYGHGTYSADGEMLFTTENDFEAGMGAVGVWDVSAGYARTGELASGGVGPHDMRLLPGGQTLVVANGGIETHPESGRSKLNLSGMRPNLCYLEFDGRIADVIELDSEFHRNSIRHLAVGRDATVAFAMQWQGDAARHPPLLGVHKPGRTARLLAAPSDDHIRLQGYAGSIAIAGDGSTITITSPRGGVLQVFDAGSESFLGQLQIADVCGVSPSGPGFVFTSGTGLVAGLIGLSQTWRSRHNCSWDNHLVPVRNCGSSV